LTPKIDSLVRWLTRKILFALPDGAQIETVLMDYETRETVCVSTQAGCGMGCTFCATGQGGFQRNLTGGEIVEQVLFFERELRQREQATAGQGDSGTTRSHTKPEPRSPIPDLESTSHRLTNLVLMGMGEPFANYTALMDARIA
jgi:23S rRNA (adenine2503-C2)-methyltransferase